MNIESNKFKAVQFMRSQREELGRLHVEHPSLYHMQMKEIQAKYGLRKVRKGETSPHGPSPKEGA